MPPEEIEAKPDSLINKEDSLAYWENATADVDGMLGGVPSVFSSISRIDIQGSKTFLARLGIGIKQGRKKLENCVEGGAGYARFRIPPPTHVVCGTPANLSCYTGSGA